MYDLITVFGIVPNVGLMLIKGWRLAIAVDTVSHVAQRNFARHSPALAHKFLRRLYGIDDGGGSHMVKSNFFKARKCF